MAEISIADWSWLDAVADRFELAYRRGGRPLIEVYLAEVSRERIPVLLDELLNVEIELRRGAGEEPTAEEYHARFPAHVGVIDAAFRPDPPDLGSPEVEGPRLQPWAFPGREQCSEATRSFLSTDFDKPSPRSDDDFATGARGDTAVAFHATDTRSIQEMLGSTATAPPDGAPPLERPGPGSPGWRVGHFLLVERLGAAPGRRVACCAT